MDNKFDFDWMGNIFGNFNITKEQIIDSYIKGRITKDEFIKRMKELDR